MTWFVLVSQKVFLFILVRLHNTSIYLITLHRFKMKARIFTVFSHCPELTALVNSISPCCVLQYFSFPLFIISFLGILLILFLARFLVGKICNMTIIIDNFQCQLWHYILEWPRGIQPETSVLKTIQQNSSSKTCQRLCL